MNLLSPQIKLMLIGVLMIATTVIATFLKTRTPTITTSNASNSYMAILAKNTAIRFLSLIDENGESDYGFLKAELSQKSLKEESKNGFTIESYFSPDIIDEKGSTIFFAPINSDSELSLEISKEKSDTKNTELAFNLSIPNSLKENCESEMIYAKTILPSNKLVDWHHLALTADVQGRIKLYFDGHNITSNDEVNFDLKCLKMDKIFLGANPSESGFVSRPFQGLLDDFRFSKKIRYEKDFVPNESNRQIQTDDFDILVLRFNENLDIINIRDDSNYSQKVSSLGVIDYVSP